MHTVSQSVHPVAAASVSQQQFTATEGADPEGMPALSPSILPVVSTNYLKHSTPQQSLDRTSNDDGNLLDTSPHSELDGEPLCLHTPQIQGVQQISSPALQFLSDQVKSFRIFLDICSGASRPLSKAMTALHADVIAYDILLDSRMDLLDDSSFEALLKLCAIVVQ